MAGASPSWGSGSPIRNTTRDGALPHRPSAESIELPACEAPPDPYWMAMALYREARNPPSDISYLLCCQKILQI
jgi:hypothetical protein